MLAYVLRLLVFRQVQTGIHSLMVSDAASLITQAMLRSRADLLIGQLNCMSEEEVQHKAAQFLEYIRIGALLHDIGKVCCSSVVNMQYRRLSAVEYKTIQFHPQSSAEILLRIPQLACFYDMAVGHHKSYDGKSGYPKDFHIEASPQKIFIDMIAICDSLDAATDSYGRNYAKAKKFETVVRELRSRAGTQYSGVIVDLICEDEALRSQLKDLLENRRDEACRKTFWILNADIKDIAAAIRKTSCWRNG
ncbi:MAG: HD-GYP domain-containing protein [[Clostridium] innocuum]